MRDVTVVDAAKITTGAVPAAALTNVDLVEGTKGTDIVSAGTMVIGTDGGYFDITGTTGISTMTVAAGRVFTLQFDAVVTLTHSSTLYLSGAANFTTEANDHMTFISVAANDVRQIGTGLKDGGSPVAGGVQVFVGQIQYNTSTTANQAFTGVGFAPKAVIFFGAENNSAEVSFGLDDGSDRYSIVSWHSGAGNWSHSSFSLGDFESGSNYWTGIITSLDADGFTIQKFKTGSPTGLYETKFLAIG